MLLQRGPVEAPPPPRATAKLANTRNAKSGKMSFKDKHALESLPGQMTALQARIDALGAELADANLYRKNAARFAAATAELSQAQAKLATAEERWLELEAMRETLETAR
jgi:ATP-binding cassette subfamily F protein uup